MNNFNGQVTITATLNGACGNANLTRAVWVGNPEIIGDISGATSANCNNTYIYSFNGGVNGNASWIWQASDHFTKSTSGSNYYLTPIYSGEGYVSIEATNACGSSYLCQTICANGCSTGLLVFPGSHPCYTSGLCGFSLMSVSPNPSSDKLTIKANMKLGNSESKNPYIVTISDDQGNKVFSKPLAEEELVIDKGLLKVGTYYVKVFLEGRLMETKRIIIE